MESNFRREFGARKMHDLAFVVHFLFPAALRLTEYAIATACFCGLPAAISAFTFWLNAFFDGDFSRGISISMITSHGEAYSDSGYSAKSGADE